MELVYISADLALALIFCYEQQFQALVQAIIAARPPADQVRPPQRSRSTISLGPFLEVIRDFVPLRVRSPWPQI